MKYVGGVHGDEPSGRALTAALAEWLCAHWRSEPRAKRIVTTMHLWLVPAMNPDGFDAKARGNGCARARGWHVAGGLLAVIVLLPVGFSRCRCLLLVPPRLPPLSHLLLLPPCT